MMRLEPHLRQLLLDLPIVEGATFEDFLRDASNAAALDAVLAWPDWPSTALIVDGPSGCGKSHLGRIWAQRTDALWLPAAAVFAQAQPIERLAPGASCVIDDVDLVEDDVLLLQLYNTIREGGGHLLATASAPLGAWLPRLPDLASRLRTAWTVHVSAPRDELLAAVLVKQFRDRQIDLPADVLAYLLARMERSFAAARAIVRALDHASLHAKRPITVPLARRVLELSETDAEA
ncbi:MAG: DNA replication protein [Geminicoccaceae bacterium]|nr:DNA replication protein [Geminicoccaceae bacterium]